MQTIIWQSLLAAGATIGFAVLFNAPPRVLPFCGLIGGAAFAARWTLQLLGLSADLGTLLGAMLVALLGEWGARRYKTPALVFKVTGFIPFVPGVLAYRTVLELLNGDYLAGLDAGFHAVIRAGAIAGGIGTITALFRMRERSVMQRSH